MSKKKLRRERLEISEALETAGRILGKGCDAELRLVDGGSRAIVYEVRKTKVQLDADESSQGTNAETG